MHYRSSVPAGFSIRRPRSRSLRKRRTEVLCGSSMRIVPTGIQIEVPADIDFATCLSVLKRTHGRGASENAQARTLPRLSPNDAQPAVGVRSRTNSAIARRERAAAAGE